MTSKRIAASAAVPDTALPRSIHGIGVRSCGMPVTVWLKIKDNCELVYDRADAIKRDPTLTVRSALQ